LLPNQKAAQTMKKTAFRFVLIVTRQSVIKTLSIREETASDLTNCVRVGTESMNLQHQDKFALCKV
jgi:hypothetical protein